jgi:hypothetical protein
MAADWDDGLVLRKDGTFFKRHTIDGVVTLNQSPVTVIAGMISANRGRILESAGTVWSASSAPETPNSPSMTDCSPGRSNTARPSRSATCSTA